MFKTHILFILITAGLIFSQSKENFVSEIRKAAFKKNLSVEFLGSVHFTFRHAIILGGADLPPHMWAGNCGINYQFAPHLVFSCVGSYSYTKNLYYKVTGFIRSSEMKFSMGSFSGIVAFQNTNYMIGGGVEISHIDGFRRDVNLDGSTIFSTANRTLVRPVVNLCAVSNTNYPLYLKIQMDSRILHFVKIGSEKIDLPKVQPSLCIGLGYRFYF